MYITLKSRGDIDRIFGTGARLATQELTMLYIETPGGRGQDGRVVFVAGKKMGGAVARNRAKRVLRAAVRRRGDAWPGYDVALVAKQITGRAKPAALDSALLRLGEKLGR